MKVVIIDHGKQGCSCAIDGVERPTLSGDRVVDVLFLLAAYYSTADIDKLELEVLPKDPPPKVKYTSHLCKTCGLGFLSVYEDSEWCCYCQSDEG